MEPQTQRRLELSVLGLAVLLRGASLWTYGQTPFADHPMVDAYTYWAQAEQLTEGRDPFAQGFYQPPGYPAFLWALGKLTAGPDLGFTRLVHAVMGVLTTGFLIQLGRRIGRGLAAPWAGAAAGLLYTLYPSTLLFEQDILTPALTSFLFTGALLLIWPDDDRPPGPGRAGLSGLLQGLAVVVHPTYLLAAAACGGWLALRARRSAVAFGLLLGMALVPTAWRNATVYDQPALVSHNAGLNFYLGNNRDWRETMFTRPGLPFRKLVLEADPASRDVAERNDYWRDRTLEEIREKPVVWLSVLGTKALWSVSDVEIPRNEDYRCRTDDGPLRWIASLPVSYGLVFPFALAGGVVLLRRRGPGRLVSATWLLLHAPLVLFLVADRYRLATWPLVCLAAVAGLAAMAAAWRQRAETRPSRSWGLLLLALPLPFLPLDERTAYDPAWCLHVDGNLALMQDEPDLAREFYEQALALDPEDWGARDFLARTLSSQGRADAALELMAPLVEWFPDHYPTLYFVARQEERRGNLDAAATYMGRAWRVPGERTNTGLRYLRLLHEAGRSEELRSVLQEDPELARHPKVRELLAP